MNHVQDFENEERVSGSSIKTFVEAARPIYYSGMNAAKCLVNPPLLSLSTGARLSILSHRDLSLLSPGGIERRCFYHEKRRLAYEFFPFDTPVRKAAGPPLCSGLTHFFSRELGDELRPTLSMKSL